VAAPSGSPAPPVRMPPIRLSVVASLALTVFVACGCTAADEKVEKLPSVQAAVGRPAPAFLLKDQDDKPVSLANFKGKIVLLEWTNPACPFVQRHYQAGTFAAIERKYAGRGVIHLAINSTAAGSAAADNRAFAVAQKISYPILDDAAGTVGKTYGAKATPHLVVIDRRGNVAYRGAPDNDPDGDKPAADRVNHVEQAIDAVLAGKPVETPETKTYGCPIKYAG
jgi:peroxiredoxin